MRFGMAANPKDLLTDANSINSLESCWDSIRMKCVSKIFVMTFLCSFDPFAYSLRLKPIHFVDFTYLEVDTRAVFKWRLDLLSRFQQNWGRHCENLTRNLIDYSHPTCFVSLYWLWHAANNRKWLWFRRSFFSYTYLLVSLSWEFMFRDFFSLVVHSFSINAFECDKQFSCGRLLNKILPSQVSNGFRKVLVNPI